MFKWMFEDYRHGNSWVAFDDLNQQLLESAWQTIKRCSPSQVRGDEASMIEIQDSHFSGFISVCPQTGYAHYDAGDFVIDRLNHETGSGEHEWKDIRWRDESDSEGDYDDRSSDDEQKQDFDIVRSGGGIPICLSKEQFRRDEGYGSYESRSSVNDCSPPGSGNSKN